MREDATVTSKGQITIPAAVRRKLNVKPGDRLSFRQNADGDFIVEARRGSLADLRGLIKRPGVTSEQIDDWINEARGRKARGKI